MTIGEHSEACARFKKIRQDALAAVDAQEAAFADAKEAFRLADEAFEECVADLQGKVDALADPNTSLTDSDTELAAEIKAAPVSR
jgi:predicted phage gp36 major capsid-like protein